MVDPAYEGGGELGGFDPEELQGAYRIPRGVSSPQTVAIIETAGYPSAESDLAKYREKYGLPACTKANGCFSKVNQKGEEGNYPKEENGDWEKESALDEDMVSAACPECHILMVESPALAPGEMLPEMNNLAVALGASEVSNSWGRSEQRCGTASECTAFDEDFEHPGVPITVASGDSGYDDEYEHYAAPNFPATSPAVVAVGGTELFKASGAARGWREEAWRHGGGGCSTYMSKPHWQDDGGCAERMDNDVAAVAAPETPVSVYEGRWIVAGGTSVGAPLVAGILAHASAYVRSLGAEAFYEDPGSLFDITTGVDWDGSLNKSSPCAPNEYLCNAEVGYDGPTGLGTLDGVPVLAAGSGPTVETGSASGVAQTVGSLTGTVNPNGEEVSECEFEYGPSTSYGTTVACSKLPGSGGDAVEVSASLAKLSPDSEYHYRLTAGGVGGTAEGEDRTFKTLQWPAPSVEGEAASGVAQTTATLNATVNPNGGEVTECVLEYGSSLPSGKSVACSPAPGSGTSAVSVTGSLSGLAAATGYEYRVIAANAGGVSASAAESFTTLPYEAPEFGRCVSVAARAGTYSSAACTKAGGREDYEWDHSVGRSGFGIALAAGVVKLETVKGLKITCSGGSGGGEYTGLKAVGDLVLRLTGCTEAGQACTSPGAGGGEAVSASLEGLLGLEKAGASSASDKIALAVSAPGHAGALLEVLCGTSSISISGTVLVPVTADKAVTSATLKFAALKGKQKPESFAGGASEVLQASLDGGAPEQMGLTASLRQTSEEAVEINTVL